MLMLPGLRTSPERKITAFLASKRGVLVMFKASVHLGRAGANEWLDCQSLQF